MNTDESVNQIKDNRTQNPYRGKYHGRGGLGRGAPRGAPSGRGGYIGNNGNCQPKGDNQQQNGTEPTCWYCNIYGYRQEDCPKRIRENAPCKGLNGSTYWQKQKASPVGEDKEQHEIQGVVGEMYTSQPATLFSGFQ